MIFRPEFLNRVDEIVVFYSLSQADLQEIVKIQLRRVDQLLGECGLHIEFAPEALSYLAQVGWDPDFGARPLKRAIQREMQDPLALRVLSGEVRPGQTIRIEKGPQGLEFH